MYFCVSYCVNYFKLACLENSADPDQLASEEAEASRSRSTQFPIKSLHEKIMYYCVSYLVNYFKLACFGKQCGPYNQLASKEAEVSQSRSALFPINSINEFYKLLSSGQFISF